MDHLRAERLTITMCSMNHECVSSVATDGRMLPHLRLLSPTTVDTEVIAIETGGINADSAWRRLPKTLIDVAPKGRGGGRAPNKGGPS